MRHIFFCFAMFVCTAVIAQHASAAIIMIDDFEDPVAPSPSHNSAPAGNIRTPLSSGGVATSRNLIGDAQPALAVASDLSVLMTQGVGEMASLIWLIPSTDIGQLGLVDFSPIAGSGTYEVFANGDGTTSGSGISLGSGALPTAAGTSVLSHASFFGATVVELKFTSTSDALLFDVEAITATPEPASLSLLGLSMLGALGYRRKRKNCRRLVRISFRHKI